VTCTDISRSTLKIVNIPGVICSLRARAYLSWHDAPAFGARRRRVAGATQCSRLY
jgi:hypothetical protein